jgi:Flp pilus assembly protein TadG
VSGRRRQQGLAIVEATLALPVLLLVMMPIVEIGRAFVQYAELSHRVRAATRHVAELALSGTTGVPVITAELATAATNLVVYGSTAANGGVTIPGLSSDEVVVTLTTDNQVNVSVTHPYQSLVAGLLPGLGFGSDIVTSITMTMTSTQRPL